MNKKLESKFASGILKNGGVGVLLTDTLYGIVGRALDKKAVERIYKVKGRNNKKPFIILISDVNDLRLFGINLDTQIEKLLSSFWPGPVSIVMPCPLKKLEYLHRGTKTLAFRLPKKKSLIALLRETGPLVAPSANLEGLPSAKNIIEAKKYFSDAVDFYIKGGVPKTKPSKIVKVTPVGLEIIRK